MKNRVYILGYVPKEISKECENKFFAAKNTLTKFGYEAINPLDNLLDKSLSENAAKRKNLGLLAQCKAVYVLPCIIPEKGNIELKVAIDLNLIFINGFLNFELSIDKKMNPEILQIEEG